MHWTWRLTHREQRGVRRSQLCLALAHAAQDRRRVWRIFGDNGRDKDEVGKTEQSNKEECRVETAADSLNSQARHQSRAKTCPGYVIPLGPESTLRHPSMRSSSSMRVKEDFPPIYA